MPKYCFHSSEIMEGCLSHSFTCDVVVVCGTRVKTEFHITTQAALKLTASQHPKYVRGMRCYACPNFILLFIIFYINYKWEGSMHIYMCGCMPESGILIYCSPSNFLRWVSHWTWNLQFWWGWLDVKFLGSTCFWGYSHSRTCLTCEY